MVHRTIFAVCHPKTSSKELLDHPPIGVIRVIGRMGVMGRIGVIGLIGFIGVIGPMTDEMLLLLQAIGCPLRS